MTMPLVFLTDLWSRPMLWCQGL